MFDNRREACRADELPLPGNKGGPKGGSAAQTAVRRSPTTPTVAGSRSEEARNGGQGAVDQRLYQRLEDDEQSVQSVHSSPRTPDEAFIAVGLQVPGPSPRTPDEAFIAAGLQVPGSKVGQKKNETEGGSEMPRDPTTPVAAGARTERAHNP